MIIPLLEPNQREPGTRIHKGATCSRPFGVTPPTAGHRRSIRARGLVGSQLTRKGIRGPPNDRGCTRMHYSGGRRHSIRTHTRKFPEGSGDIRNVHTKSFPGTGNLILNSQSTLLNDPRRILSVAVSPPRKVLQTFSQHPCPEYVRQRLGTENDSTTKHHSSSAVFLF